MVNMISVASSNIASIGYDALSRELYVRFHYGKTYIYSNVPENVYRNLMSAGSKGSYLDSFVKGIYPYRPL
ncbi:KTSC domain-containing protein [Macrococcus brunensis]|uniref:KTSC domain-containing protein n=1 Tax=Macrococcus brunensis TaxID=198483 RepID=UPI001EEFA899|nr:KTSC domain-containing protein [Macrococcus brunensis]ULG72976.1 KTSC domain-containing protein [Macrococcus brunensis]